MTIEEPREPSRRELMKPLHMIGLALICALFAGAVTAVSMGLFQTPIPVEPGQLTQHGRALLVAGIVAGVTFIVVTVGVALMLLALDPADFNKPVQRPVLYDPESTTDAEPDAPGSATPPRA